MLEGSELNPVAYFSSSVRKETASVLMQAVRSLTPNSRRLWNLECQYGGVPKKGQLVREGHLSRFSEIIDGVEKIAIQQLGFENYMNVLKKCTEQTMHETSAKYVEEQAKKPETFYSSSDDETSPKKKKHVNLDTPED